MAWVFGKAEVKYTHHPSPVEFMSANDEKTISLLQIVEQSTPPCNLNPLLFNGHLQTFYTASRAVDTPIYYKRGVFEAEEEAYFGSFAVDFVVPPYRESDDSLPRRTSFFTDDEFSRLGGSDGKPMLIVLHGLSGGSFETYLKACLEPLVNAGWEACVVISRGCAKSKLTSPMLYNARATWDMRQIVRWCHKTWPNRKLYGLGFSLGANMLINYLGEEGEQCLLDAAVVCSNPWNLELSAMSLGTTWLGRNVYLPLMGGNLRHLFEKDVQCPTWGYPSTSAYYRDASSSDAVLAVRVPLLAVHAEDDPFSFGDTIPWDEFQYNPYTVLLSTSLGGHLGWFETGGTRWFPRPISQFLMRMFEMKCIKPESKSKVDDSHAVRLADKVCPFAPMQRKLLMPIPMRLP